MRRRRRRRRSGCRGDDHEEHEHRVERPEFYLPKMRTQLVAARTVAETLADLATGRGPAPTRGSNGAPILEIAGSREENLVGIARLLVAQRGETVRIEAVDNPDDPDGALYESGALLPGPDAILAGPTFEEWLRGQTDEMA